MQDTLSNGVNPYCRPYRAFLHISFKQDFGELSRTVISVAIVIILIFFLMSAMKLGEVRIEIA